MTGNEQPVAHSAAAVVKGVMRKTALLTIVAAVASAALQMTIRPGDALWPVPAGVLFGGAIALANFRWLAYAVERVYLRKGTSSVLANIAAAAINILKLSAIFVVLFVVIKNQWVNLIGLVAGLTTCFGAIIWQGYGLMTGPEKGRDVPPAVLRKKAGEGPPKEPEKE